MPSVKPQRPDSFLSRLLPQRQILIRTSGGYRTLTIGTGSQLGALIVVYLGTTLVAFGTTGYAAGQARIVEQERRIALLQHVDAESRRSRDGSETQLRQMISDLSRIGLEQRTTIDSLTELQATLEGDLERSRTELDVITRERDAARQASAQAGQLAVEGSPAAGLAEQELRQRYALLEAQLAATTSERDQLRRTESGLRWRVGMLETRLSAMRQSMSAEAGRLRAWIVQQVSALEQVLATSGIDVDRLIERVDDRLSSGQGGPLEPVPLAGMQAGRVAFQPGLKEELSRLRAVHALMRVMPLVAPMEVYRTTSGFGVRRDPIANRPAMHTGLDFGGPDGARVLATAPGRIVTAGPSGAYGNLVEIDHGMGITTRYGHLKRVLVKAGAPIALHEPVGIMGSTGRSTGEHLHYEVRIDGVAYDPSQFLEAGRHLGNVFKG